MGETTGLLPETPISTIPLRLVLAHALEGSHSTLMSWTRPLNAVGSLQVGMEAQRVCYSCLPLSCIVLFRPNLQYVNNDEPAAHLRAQPGVFVEWLCLSSTRCPCQGGRLGHPSHLGEPTAGYLSNAVHPLSIEGEQAVYPPSTLPWVPRGARNRNRHAHPYHNLVNHRAVSCCRSNLLSHAYIYLAWHVLLLLSTSLAARHFLIIALPSAVRTGNRQPLFYSPPSFGPTVLPTTSSFFFSVTTFQLPLPGRSSPRWWFHSTLDLVVTLLGL